MTPKAKNINKTNELLAISEAKYPNLCSMCASPGDCSSEDLHAGYWGALDCLTNAHGDVAWTKHDAVTSYFNDTKKVRNNTIIIQ